MIRTEFQLNSAEVSHFVLKNKKKLKICFGGQDQLFRQTKRSCSLNSNGR